LLHASAFQLSSLQRRLRRLVGHIGDERLGGED